MAIRLLHTILLFLIFSSSIVPLSAQTDDDIALVDSLQRSLSLTTDKAQQVDIIYNIAMAHYSVDSTRYYALRLVDLARQVGYAEQESVGYGLLSWVEFHNHNYTQACLYAQQGLVIADSIGDKKRISNQYYYLGNAYGMLNDFNTAISHYAKALDIFTELGETERICIVLRNMAHVEYTNQLFDDAKRHVYASLATDTTINSLDGLAEDYYMLGEIALGQYTSQKHSSPDISLLAEAKNNYKQALHYAELSGDEYCLIHTYTFLIDELLEESRVTRSISERSAKLDSCRVFFAQNYPMAHRLGYDVEIKMLDNLRCQWLIQSGKLSRAKSIIDSVYSIYIQDENTYADDLPYIYSCYADYYHAVGDADMALKYNNIYHEKRYNARQSDFVANAARSVMVGEYNMKLREREIRYDSEASERRLIIRAISVVLFFVVILAIVLVRGYMLSRRVNRKLDQKNCELEQQKEEMLVQNERLEEQRNLLSAANSQITDSINYASLIQGAAMPSDKYLDKLFGEHFVIFRPKDIVSGDFYWASERDGQIILAVADCTGHGVPGAFVSMLGISILNDLVSNVSSSNVSAGHLLDELRTKLTTALHQRGDENSSRDGMDIGLVIIDSEFRSLHFAGAYRPLFVHHEGSLIKIDADRMPIGVYADSERPFTDHHITLHSGDMLYLFTDGIVDQFGFDPIKGKEAKYTVHRLSQLLNQIYSLPCAEQSVIIQQSIDSWRRVLTAEQSEQTDDNLFVGIRVR